MRYQTFRYVASMNHVNIEQRAALPLAFHKMSQISRDAGPLLAPPTLAHWIRVGAVGQDLLAALYYLQRQVMVNWNLSCRYTLCA